MDEYINAVQQQITQNNSWSAEQAQKQMDFQERMSNTAHQREIADLKAAGLNPVLSARLGGASTPSGAMANADNSGTSALAQVLTKVLDIQNENAKALQAVANNNRGSAGSSDNSASGLTSTDVSGALGIFGINVPNSAADVVASFINGVKGNDNGKNKATSAFEAGKKINSGLNSDSAINRIRNTVTQMVRTAADSLGFDVKKPSVHSNTSSSSKIKDKVLLKGSTR